MPVDPGEDHGMAHIALTLSNGEKRSFNFGLASTDVLQINDEVVAVLERPVLVLRPASGSGLPLFVRTAHVVEAWMLPLDAQADWILA